MAQNKKDIKKLDEAAKGGADVSAEIKRIKTLVIGMPPFNGPE